MSSSSSSSSSLSSSSSSSQSLISHSIVSNEKSLNTASTPPDDGNEISTLINLLILRVECLAHDQLNTSLASEQIYPTIKQVDQNLLEYLYYLFNKFTTDDPDLSKPMIDKTNFVHACQTFVRNGCFTLSPATDLPDQSAVESTTMNTNRNDLTSVHEYRAEKSSATGSISTTPSSDQDVWLVVDIEPGQADGSTMDSNESNVSSIHSDQCSVLTCLRPRVMISCSL